MTKPHIGLLPLYLELYDQAMPEVRGRAEEFYHLIETKLRNIGVDVTTVPVCRVAAEFADAVQSFERAQTDCIVTLHLSYSPSLESAEALARTKLPLVILDTTPAYSFGPNQNPDEIMYNHGIHGVQDMCNLLLRNNKEFRIEAGHWEMSDVLDRIAAWARAARIASAIRSSRIGLIGEPFEGMGDFAISPNVMRDTIGIETVRADASALRSLVPATGDPAVEAEMTEDLNQFTSKGLDRVAHSHSVRAGIAVRRWIEQERLTGFTMNFMDIDQASGLPTVPFLEASKSMARGLGYAGEGDILTAALVGALAGSYPDTTFTEMFCPNWEGNSVFLSHMGEMNLNLAAGKATLIRKPFPWTDADDPVVPAGRLKPGKALLVNLAPGPNGEMRLIVASGNMQDAPGEDKMAETVHGWFHPDTPVPEFLTAYSECGGTHHLALVYGAAFEDMNRFAAIMGWKGISV